MGTLALAAKISHDPLIVASERAGPMHGCRRDAIEGLRAIGDRCRALGVDTLVVLDARWPVLGAYRVNGAAEFVGQCTSRELPDLVHGLAYEHPGHPALAIAIARAARSIGLAATAHDDAALGLDWGAVVPLRHLDPPCRFRVVVVSAGCEWHTMEDSARFGLALGRAVQAQPDTVVALVASGSLSHRFAPPGELPAYVNRVWNLMLEGIDHELADLWERGRWKDACETLPMVAEAGFGLGRMHDTAMLLGALGWDRYTACAEIVTPCWGSCGTGQVNALFPVTPLPPTWLGLDVFQAAAPP